MIGLIRWIKGYVKIKIWGYAPERFMNLCTNAGIMLWEITGSGEYYVMCMSISDFFGIKKMAHKTKIRAIVLERHGLPFWVKNVRNRKIFLAGTVICLSFLLFMQQFLWAIEFQGNQQITREVLQDFLEKQGVEYGVRIRKLDLQYLEETLRESFEQITWASVHRNGTKLSVFVKENDLPSMEEQRREAAAWEFGGNLIAARDGQVVSILTRAGIPKVREQDVVKKGDVLVNGQIPVQNDDGTVRDWQFCLSDADIMLQYEKEVSVWQPYFYEYKNYTNREKKYRFFLLGSKRYFLRREDNRFLHYDKVVEQKQVQLFSQIDLPVFTGIVTCREYLPVEAVYDTETAKELVISRFCKIVDSLEQKGLHIIEKDVKIIRKTNGLQLHALLTVHELAAILSEAAPVKVE